MSPIGKAHANLTIETIKKLLEAQGVSACQVESIKTVKCGSHLGACLKRLEKCKSGGGGPKYEITMNIKEMGPCDSCE